MTDFQYALVWTVIGIGLAGLGYLAFTFILSRYRRGVLSDRYWRHCRGCERPETRC